MGGPVPDRPSEKKTFFFYNQEWRRQVNGNEINASSVPTAARGGDFSYLLPANGCTGGSCGQLKVPVTTDPAEIAKLAQFGLTPGGIIPNNVIPSGLLDSNATALLKAGLFPAANAANNQYYAVVNQLTFYREETVRIDHQTRQQIEPDGFPDL